MLSACRERERERELRRDGMRFPSRGRLRRGPRGGDTPLGALPWKIDKGVGGHYFTRPPGLFPSSAPGLLNFLVALYELCFIYFV
jgi:hypothetical protein